MGLIRAYSIQLSNLPFGTVPRPRESLERQGQCLSISVLHIDLSIITDGAPDLQASVTAFTPVGSLGFVSTSTRSILVPHVGHFPMLIFQTMSYCTAEVPKQSLRSFQL